MSVSDVGLKVPEHLPRLSLGAVLQSVPHRHRRKGVRSDENVSIGEIVEDVEAGVGVGVENVSSDVVDVSVRDTFQKLSF